jgi:hypothetical protein
MEHIGLAAGFGEAEVRSWAGDQIGCNCVLNSIPTIIQAECYKL